MISKDSNLIRLGLDGTWQIAYGPWMISEDETEFVLSGWPEEPFNRDALCLSDVRMADGIFAAEIKVDQIIEGGLDAHLVFRFSSTERYMFAGLGGWEYKYGICQKTPEESILRKGGWEPVAHDGKLSDILPDHWYRLRVEFTDNDIDLFLGEACVLRYVSPQRYSYSLNGNIGFRGFGRSKIRFRNPRAFRRTLKKDLGSRLQNVDLSFMADAALRSVAYRDLEEAARLDAGAAPKATVVLLGSIAEAVLLDMLQTQEVGAKKCSSARKDALRRWNLDTMIEVAKELGVIGNTTYAISHILRGYRNLIHPGRPEAQKLEPGMSQAVGATDFVLALLKELARS